MTFSLRYVVKVCKFPEVWTDCGGFFSHSVMKSLKDSCTKQFGDENFQGKRIGDSFYS